MIPLVSVVIPVYGVEDYIEKCSRSLFEQSLSNMEFIFVDDCTLDRSIEVLKKVIEDYPYRRSQVKIVRTPMNSGLCFARRYAMQFVTGKYIIHCDSDDWVDHTMYEEMYQVAEKNGYDMVISDFQLSSTGKPFKSSSFTNDRILLMKSILLGKLHSSLCTKLVRKDVYDNIIKYPSGNMREDMTIAIQLVYYSNNIGYYDKALYHYYVNQDSISRSMTYSKIVSRFEQSVQNANIISKFIDDTGLNHCLTKSINILRFTIMMELWPILHTEEGSKLWNTQNMNVSFLRVLSYPVPVSFKLKYIIYKLGLLPMVRNTNH